MFGSTFSALLSSPPKSEGIYGTFDKSSDFSLLSPPNNAIINIDFLGRLFTADTIYGRFMSVIWDLLPNLA